MIPEVLNDEDFNELARYSGFELAIFEIAKGRKLAKETGQREYFEIFDSLLNWFCNRQNLELGFNRLLKQAEDEANKLL